jgi:hypothetical protein
MPHKGNKPPKTKQNTVLSYYDICIASFTVSRVKGCFLSFLILVCRFAYFYMPQLRLTQTTQTKGVFAALCVFGILMGPANIFEQFESL